MKFNTTEEILEDFRHGKMVLILDDEDRENEGDLIIAADVVTPQHITFFAPQTASKRTLFAVRASCLPHLWHLEMSQTQ